MSLLGNIVFFVFGGFVIYLLVERFNKLNRQAVRLH
jgi:hypothetical protein